jgi:signal transduction histidine kinase
LVERRGEQLDVVVTDTGPGLTPEELERVGDRFWRSPRHQDVDGSGLGLSIARALVTAGGGQVGFAANEPHGLVVRFTVPRRLLDLTVGAPPQLSADSSRRTTVNS